MVEVDEAQIAQKFLVSFMEPDDVDVLEVGCGDGRITSQLAGWPASYAAVDTDIDKLEEARTRVPDVAFSECPAEALDFPDDSFDVVLFSMSLHHTDPVRALAEAHRVLRLGGRAVVLEPVAFSEAERCIAPLMDETPAYKRAQEAMADSEFTEVRRELFPHRCGGRQCGRVRGGSCSSTTIAPLTKTRRRPSWRSWTTRRATCRWRSTATLCIVLLAKT